jgi:hypothetical protein
MVVAVTDRRPRITPLEYAALILLATLAVVLAFEGARMFF